MNTSHTRDWVVGRLRTISGLTGIQKAEYLARALEERIASFRLGGEHINGALPHIPKRPS